jgi:hypothetical protein
MFDVEFRLTCQNASGSYLAFRRYEHCPFNSKVWARVSLVVMWMRLRTLYLARNFVSCHTLEARSEPSR